MLDQYTSKRMVLERFLAFVRSFATLDGMRIGTLGGGGIEAELWQRVGISGEQGWLIERHRGRSVRLLGRQFPYHYCAKLSTLPRVIRSLYGNQATMDVFHWDLCGTIAKNRGELAPLLPLIVRSAARVLAITTADERGNSALENFSAVRRRLRAQFELDAAGIEKLLVRLREEQQELPLASIPSVLNPFNPLNGAKRELGCMAHLVVLCRGLVAHGIAPVLPDQMERYVYVSRVSGRSFRMRTYLFHFPEPGKRPMNLRAFLNCWTSSPLCFVTSGGRESSYLSGAGATAPIKTKEVTMTEAEIRNAFAKLRLKYGHEYPQLFVWFGFATTEILDQLVKLLIGVETGAAKSRPARLAEARDLISRATSLLMDDTPESAMPAAVVNADPRESARDRGKRRSRSRATETKAAALAKVTGGKRSAGERLDAQWKLLRAAAEGGREFARVKREVRRALRLDSYHFRGILAAAMNQGVFAMRVIKDQPAGKREELLSELAALYSRVGKALVTVEVLRKKMEVARCQSVERVKKMNALHPRNKGKKK